MPESYIQLPPDGSGKKIRTIVDTVSSQSVHTTFVTFRQEPTYWAYGTVTAAVANLFAILNRNTAKVVKIYRVNVFLSQLSAITGTLWQGEIRRVTATAALSGGTAITPIKLDTTDPDLTNVDVRTSPTTTLTTVGTFKSIIMSNDEPTVTTLDADAYATQVFPRDAYSVLSFDIPSCKPIVLRTNGTTHEGLCIAGTSGTVGTIGISVLFTYDDQ